MDHNLERISSILTHQKQKSGEIPGQDSHRRDNLPDNISGTFSKIGELYDDLQGIVTSLDSKIDAAIEKEAKELLSSYKADLIKVTNELKECKRKLSDQESKLQRDSQIKLLSKTLEKYQRGKLEFALTASQQRKEILQLKFELKSIGNEKAHLEKKLKAILTEKKAYQIALKKIDTSFGLQQVEMNSVVCGRENKVSEPLHQEVDYNVKTEQFIEFIKTFEKEEALLQNPEPYNF